MSLETELRSAATRLEKQSSMFNESMQRDIRLIAWAVREASLDTRMLAEMQRHVICDHYKECQGCPFEQFVKPDGSYDCTDYCREHPESAYYIGRRYVKV